MICPQQLILGAVIASLYWLTLRDKRVGLFVVIACVLTAAMGAGFFKLYELAAQ